MIEFKQLESGTPPDIEVTTDDANAELVTIEDAIGEGDFEGEWVEHFHAVHPGDDGKVVFTVPGDEAGEFGDYYQPLGEYLERANAEAMARMHQDAASE